VLREGITTLTRRTSALLGVEAVEVSASTPAIPEDARVVVGTEAVLSRVRRAGLVCFADLDDYLCAPRAHGGLEALRAIGLAGRIVGARSAQDPGLVLVQTRMPADPVIEAAVNGSPGPLIAAESERAAQLGLPPNVATCALEGAGAAAYAEALGRAGLVVTEEAGRMVATAHDHVILCDALRSTPRPAASVRVVVDPVG
jgi:primosomal protein N'